MIQSQNNCHVHVVISENLSFTNFHIVFKILVLRPIRLSKRIYGSNRFTILLVLKTNSFLAFSVLTFRISKISVFLARVVRLFNTISFRSLESRLARSKMLFSWMNMGRGKMFSKRSSLMYTPVLFPVIQRITFFWNRSNCNWSPLDICVHESPYNNTRLRSLPLIMATQIVVVFQIWRILWFFKVWIS